MTVTSIGALGERKGCPRRRPLLLRVVGTGLLALVISAGCDVDDSSAAWRAVDVVDGDTLDVSGPGGELTVRIVGINTPEIDECLYEEAAEAVAELVDGEDLVLVRDESDVDRFGRALRYVELADGTDVGAALVADGLALARRYEPDTARHGRYAELQRSAREAGLGLWAPDACGVATTGVSIDVEVNADAPGDDNENLNGEWVRFTNTGPEPVDLDGWEVADESATHRYEFDDAVLGPDASITLFTGCGSDTDDARYWCATNSAVWNNDGDTVFLRDPRGNNVVVSAYSG